MVSSERRVLEIEADGLGEEDAAVLTGQR